MHERNVKKGIGFQRASYGVLRFIGGRAFMAVAGCKYQKTVPRSETFLLLGNHVEAIDPIKAVIMTARHMKFVASTDVLKGLFGAFLKLIANPIPRAKGEAADSVTRAIIENLNAGISVGMFPEGKRTLDGQTGFISRRTAEILKEAECGLVTVVYDAAPLKKPRWGHKRKGKSYARVVSEYDAESLRSMTVDEIYEIICHDLYTDCYAWQKEHKVVYTCMKGRAEGIEKILIKCPECGDVCSHISSGSGFSCAKCGAEYVLDEYDLIHSKNDDHPAKFDSVTEWNRWQKKELFEKREALAAKTRIPIFRDEYLRLFVTENGRERLLSGACCAQLYGDRLEVGCQNGEKYVFPVREMRSLGGFGSSNIMFTYQEKRYRLYAKKRLYEYKYFALWRVLNGKEMK